MKTKRDIGIYCHVPFCIKKCAYCDFYSGCFYDLADRYIDALLSEAAVYAKKYPDLSVSTLYFGGGTPSSLTKEQLIRLIGGIQRLFFVSHDAEITLEANPATLDADKLIALKNAGVNRISIGVQSADDNELKTLSRLHSYNDFLSTYSLVKKYFENVSLDLMFGLPDQTVDRLEATLDRILSLDPAHISLYALKIEEGTLFSKNQDKYAFPDEDSVSEMYIRAHDILEQYGYSQYEISNYAKQDSFSRHNLRYWEGKEYLGLGPAAHSYFNKARYANKPDIYQYIASLEAGEMPEKSELYTLKGEDLLEEAIILPLRLTKGLDTERLRTEHRYDILSVCKTKIEFYLKEGYMTLHDGVLAFTSKGFLVSNTILSELLPE